MPSLVDHMSALFPAAPAEAVAAFAAAISAGSGCGSPERTDAELAGALEELALAREENVRLKGEVVRHRDGYETATRAGFDVLGERARQRRMEGYDDDHDDGHNDFTLSGAAVAYVVDARLRGDTGRGYDTMPPAEWPWGRMDWKPKGVRQSLVVAAALIVAEIERIDRHGPGRDG